jgi:hypothetical protein
LAGSGRSRKYARPPSNIAFRYSPSIGELP